MAIKAGAILHDVNGYVIDRIQSGGPGQLNIPEEKIYELGNWQSVATVRDIPDLSFDLESFDVTTEFECILTNQNPLTFPYYTTGIGEGDNTGNGSGDNVISFDSHVPIDVISPFKSRRNQYNIVKGLAVPYLTLERASYRYGLRQNAAQSFTFRGDSIFYVPGQPYYQEEAFDAGAVASGITLDVNDAVLYDDGSDSIYALCVVLVNGVTGAYKRLSYDSTDTLGYNDSQNGGGVTTVTFAGYDHGTGEGEYNQVRIAYGSTITADYDSGNDGSGLNPSGNEIHQGVSVKPAAVRPRDIDVYIYPDVNGTPTEVRLTGVQSAEVNWSVQLEMDEEFGNRHYVGMDYNTPDVTGTIGVKAFDPADLWEKISQITGKPVTEVIGPDSSVPLPLEVRIHHPDTGARIKTLYVPDARFRVPGLQGRIQTKIETSLAFTSDQGILGVFNGDVT